MPYNIVHDDAGNIYFNDRQAGQLVIFDPAGSFTRIIPLFRQQNEHAMIFGESIFVTGLSFPTPRSDRGKLIQKYSLDGKEEKVFARKDQETTIFSWAADIDIETASLYIQAKTPSIYLFFTRPQTVTAASPRYRSGSG